MPHFKFLLDQGIKHLASCFPAKRVITTEELGLPGNAPDDEIIGVASASRYLLVSANRRDFEPLARAYVAKSTKKEHGCRRVYGLVLLVPNERHLQIRVLSGLEDRLIFEGKKVTYTDVHERDLLVQVESSGAARITRSPRCPHCTYPDDQ